MPAPESEQTQAESEAAAARRGAGLFRLPGRGLIRVSGPDRVRWLNGMLSNDVAALVAGPQRSGCAALLLTPKGAIVADLNVLSLSSCGEKGDEIWLELAREAVAKVSERLQRYIVADDVTLADASDEWEQLSLEGPASAGMLADAMAADPGLAPGAGVRARIANEAVVAAAFGFSGGPAFRLFVAAGAGDRVGERLLASSAGRGLVRAGAAALEILRIEAGIPLFGRELGEQVLPAEAGLERAISVSKGCYVGQEIVARLRSRGHVNHRLVGLRFAADRLPAAGSEIRDGGVRVGEVTSACVSPAAGAIGLGFVRREHAGAGTRLVAGELPVEVAELPFVRTPPPVGTRELVP